MRSNGYHLHLQLLPRQRGHMELFFTTSQPNWLLITSRQRQGVVLPVLMIFDVYYLHGLPSTAPILALRASLASKLQRWRKGYVVPLSIGYCKAV